MSHLEFSIAVIGAGMGGYAAAIRAASSGKKVALIEKNLVGGTCLHTGCIPTKALLSHGKKFYDIQTSGKWKIQVENPHFDYAQFIESKDQTVRLLHKSLENLLQAHGVQIIRGTASFTDTHTLNISSIEEGQEKSFSLKAEKIIIATGSQTVHLPFCPCDKNYVFDSTSLLERKIFPKSIAIIGGGYIGCEYATFFSELGSQVFLIESLDSIISSQDEAVISSVEKSLKNLKVAIFTKAVIEKIEPVSHETFSSSSNRGIRINIKDQEPIFSEIALIAVGRKSYTDGLHLENTKIQTDERNNIRINENMQTSVDHIYAIGDVTGKSMLAHIAYHQGLIAASHAINEPLHHHIYYEKIPGVIFTNPEVASIGMRKQRFSQIDPSVCEGIYPVSALGRGQASKRVEGFFKILADRKTKKILGAHIVCENASSLIGELSLAIQKELTLEDIIETIHPHPTYTEGVFEAALLANNTPIHYPPLQKRKI
jgi:dihydrolipoamide dehydrogenase